MRLNWAHIVRQAAKATRLKSIVPDACIAVHADWIFFHPSSISPPEGLERYVSRFSSVRPLGSAPEYFWIDSFEVVIRDGKTKEEGESWNDVDLLDRPMSYGSFRECFVLEKAGR